MSLLLLFNFEDELPVPPNPYVEHATVAIGRYAPGLVPRFDRPWGRPASVCTSSAQPMGDTR